MHAPEAGYWRLAALAMSGRVGEAGPVSDGRRSVRLARFTISAHMRRLSGSRAICSLSPVCTLCDSANAFHPCSVYSYLLLFLRSHSSTPHVSVAPGFFAVSSEAQSH